MDANIPHKNKEGESFHDWCIRIGKDLKESGFNCIHTKLNLQDHWEACHEAYDLIVIIDNDDGELVPWGWLPLPNCLNC